MQLQRLCSKCIIGKIQKSKLSNISRKLFISVFFIKFCLNPMLIIDILITRISSFSRLPDDQALLCRCSCITNPAVVAWLIECLLHKKCHLLMEDLIPHLTTSFIVVLDCDMTLPKWLSEI